VYDEEAENSHPRGYVSARSNSARDNSMAVVEASAMTTAGNIFWADGGHQMSGLSCGWASWYWVWLGWNCGWAS